MLSTSARLLVLHTIFALIHSVRLMPSVLKPAVIGIFYTMTFTTRIHTPDRAQSARI